MVENTNLQDIANGFKFKKGDYIGAEKQLLEFADGYAILSPEEADLLRSHYDSKVRLGWLRIASTLFTKSFTDADISQKEKLCKIFFAFYSFENLEFGYDGVMDVESISDQIKGHTGIVKKNWDQFSKLTSNGAARSNLENRLFVS